MVHFAARLPAHVRVARFTDRHAWIFDTVCVALPLIALSAVVVISYEPTSLGLATGVPGWVWGVLGVVSCLPLVLRRTAPVLSAWLLLVCCLITVVCFAPLTPAVLAVPITVYTVSAFGPRRWGVFFFIAALVGSLCAGFLYRVGVSSTTSTPLSPLDLLREDAVRITWIVITLLCAALVSSAWLLGDIRGHRIRESAAVVERNELLERERISESRLAADAERMRIAREMHDIVAHSMSVMIAQADGGRFVVAHDPAKGAEVFGTIGEIGRDALTQMRSLLGVLREDSSSHRAPMPGLADLPQLIADVRASGLPVSLVGDVDDIAGTVNLPPVTELAVYRIVQESLTNTLKHAGADARSRVSITRRGDQLAVTVDDTGAGDRAPSDGRGSGLSGMAERAQIVGGELRTFADEHGFHVHLDVPFGRASAEADSPSALPRRQPPANAPAPPHGAANPAGAADPARAVDPTALRRPAAGASGEGLMTAHREEEAE